MTIALLTAVVSLYGSQRAQHVRGPASTMLTERGEGGAKLVRDCATALDAHELERAAAVAAQGRACLEWVAREDRAPAAEHAFEADEDLGAASMSLAEARRRVHGPEARKLPGGDRVGHAVVLAEVQEVHERVFLASGGGPRRGAVRAAGVHVTGTRRGSAVLGSERG